jgi:hypothetical protein
MATPSQKHPEIEKALTDMFGHDRRAVIESDMCVPPPIGCGKPATVFRDELSKLEYQISGLCQACQDSVFGGPEN